MNGYLVLKPKGAPCSDLDIHGTIFARGKGILRLFHKLKLLCRRGDHRPRSSGSRTGHRRTPGRPLTSRWVRRGGVHRELPLASVYAVARRAHRHRFSGVISQPSFRLASLDHGRLSHHPRNLALDPPTKPRGTICAQNS